METIITLFRRKHDNKTVLQLNKCLPKLIKGERCRISTDTNWQKLNVFGLEFIWRFE